MQALLGKLIKVTQYKGEAKDRLARVIGVRDTLAEPISYKQYRRYKTERSRWLITVHDLEKDVFRSYYTKYVVYDVIGQGRSWWHRIKTWWEDN